jgi:hypothetical protein
MIKVSNLETAVELAALFSECLRPYTYPKAPPHMEDIYLPYRVWNFSVDGYDICVHMTQFDVDNNGAKNIQIYSKHLITLPFYLVFKVAASFIGIKNMVFFYLVRDGKQVFCWTGLTDSDGNSVEYSKEEVKIEYYMGYEYASLND